MDFLPLLRSVRHPIITGRHVLSEVKSCILDISGSWDKVGQLDGTYWDLAAGSCDGEPSGRCRLIGSRSDAGNLVVVWWWVEMYCVLFGESWRWSAVKTRGEVEACKIQFCLRNCLCSFVPYTARDNGLHDSLSFLSRATHVSCHLICFEAS